MKRYKYRWERM